MTEASPTMIPEGSYKARLVERRYGSDTWEITEPGKPWHGRRISIHPMEVVASIQVQHLVVPLPSGGRQVVPQGKLL